MHWTVHNCLQQLFFCGHHNSFATIAKQSNCHDVKKHDVEVLECTKASGVVMTLKKSQTGVLMC